MTNKEKYYEELKKTLKDYFANEFIITKNMSSAEEKQYIEKNNKDAEIKEIYDKLRKKYNIK